MGASLHPQRHLSTLPPRHNARPCYLPRRFGPHPRRPPWLPVDPRPHVVALPLPRGPPQQLAFRPAEEGLRLQVLGLHGHWLLSSLPPGCLADQEEQAVNAFIRVLGMA